MHCHDLHRMAGVMRGATACFFGFVGYDEVCCMSAEAVDARHVVPKAVFGTIVIVTLVRALS